jgi:flotillin
MDVGMTEVVAIAAVAALIAFAILFKLMWRVAEPNEALIISGLRARAGTERTSDSLGFKIVTGKGTLVLPGLQTVRRLSLGMREAALAIECVTHQGIPVGVRGVAIFKVADDFASIANAARRFLDGQERMDAQVQQLFAGHLRAIVGSMTVEAMIRDREALSSATRESSGTDMEKLGLVIDSLQIQEIDDPTGYIGNLGRPQAAAVERDARIAQAAADREATEREQEAEALKAQARRDAEIKRAGFQAEIDQASARAQQAGPLADATARQHVVVEETKVASLEAERTEMRLQTEIRKPADADAYRQRTLAEAARDAAVFDAEAAARKTRLQGEAEANVVRTRGTAEADIVRTRGTAEADAVKARGLAEAEAVRARGLSEAAAIEARSQALAENQEAVIGQQLAERWPDIVAAAARAFEGVDHMVVMNGATGIAELISQVMTQGGAGLQVARNVLAGTGGAGNGSGAAASSDGEESGRDARPR